MCHDERRANSMLRYSTLRKACPVSHSHICICHDSPIGKAHELDVTLLAAAVLQEVCPVTRSDICMCHDSSIGRLTNSMSRCSLLQEVCPVTRSDICMCHDFPIKKSARTRCHTARRCSAAEGVSRDSLICVCSMTPSLEKRTNSVLCCLPLQCCRRYVPCRTCMRVCHDSCIGKVHALDVTLLAAATLRNVHGYTYV